MINNVAAETDLMTKKTLPRKYTTPHRKAKIIPVFISVAKETQLCYTIKKERQKQ